MVRGGENLKEGLKSELLEYAYPKKRIEATQKQYKTSKTADIFGYLGLAFVLVLCSLPMLFNNLWLWSIVFALYLTAVIICIICKDKHEKNMLIFGSTLAYFGITFSFFIANEAFKRFQISVTAPLLILSAFCVLCYEIMVIINVLYKKYSAKNNNLKSYPARASALGISAGSLIGWLIAKKITPAIEKSLWSVWILWIGMAFLFVLAISFLQKYVLYKILKPKKDTLL